MAIYYFEENISSLNLKKRFLNSWIKECILSYSKKVGDINFIFCSDEYLKEINIEYLNHHYFTDVITFNSNEGDILSGDIYISVERVKENAQIYSVDFMNELYRVMIHGVLHLVGFNDKTDEESTQMRLQEDFCLSKLKE